MEIGLVWHSRVVSGALMRVSLVGAHARPYVQRHMHLHHGGGREGGRGTRQEPRVPGVGALCHRVLGRFLPGWVAIRQRVGGQAREDLGHRDRGPGEQPRVHFVERGIGLGFQESKSSAVLSVVFSSDGKHFVSGSADNLVKIWDTNTGAKVIRFVGLRRV